MIRIPMRLFAALAIVALTAFVAACGSSDSEKSGGSATKNTGNPNTGKKGGKLEQLGASDVDFLDPGQTYYNGGYQVLYATQKTLYSFKPGDPKVQPDLAESDPEISDDKKTVTVTLKKGVKFAPPVNREIQAKDVKYAFERAFSKNVPNQYTTYFNFIEGAPKTPGNAQDISGIVVDPSDPYKLTFKLSKPQAVGFAAFLVMPVTTPVNSAPIWFASSVRIFTRLSSRSASSLRRSVKLMCFPSSTASSKLGTSSSATFDLRPPFGRPFVPVASPRASK